MTKDVLVADDQPGIRMLLKDILTDEGYDVVECETGKEAIDEIRKRSLDLVILDYKLPVMDGVEVIRTLETEGVQIPAILITGLVEEIGGDVAGLANVKEVMAKPFNIQHILDVVGNIVCEKSL